MSMVVIMGGDDHGGDEDYEVDGDNHRYVDDTLVRKDFHNVDVAGRGGHALNLKP